MCPHFNSIFQNDLLICNHHYQWVTVVSMYHKLRKDKLRKYKLRKDKLRKYKLRKRQTQECDQTNNTKQKVITFSQLFYRFGWAAGCRQGAGCYGNNMIGGCALLEKNTDFVSVEVCHGAIKIKFLNFFLFYHSSRSLHFTPLLSKHKFDLEGFVLINARRRLYFQPFRSFSTRPTFKRFSSQKL